jgi:hypothetical protein
MIRYALFIKHYSDRLGNLQEDCHKNVEHQRQAVTERLKLKLLPYRFQSVHQLQKRDKGARIQYCHWFRRFVCEGINVLDNVFFSDEAWFHLTVT